MYRIFFTIFQNYDRTDNTVYSYLSYVKSNKFVKHTRISVKSKSLQFNFLFWNASVEQIQQPDFRKGLFIDRDANTVALPILFLY